MRYTASPQIKNEQGVIAIFLAVIMGVLLLLSTTYATRVSVSELSQASQIDRSEAAYYAAEAGIEEASRRIDQNSKNVTIDKLFPEQFSGSTQTGDYLILIDEMMHDIVGTPATVNTSNTLQTPINEGTATPPQIRGQLAWRYRKVYQQSIVQTGLQVKDESIQTDVSELRENCAGGGIAGAIQDKDCSTPGVGHIFDHLAGVQYCWNTNSVVTPQIEATITQWTGDSVNKTVNTGSLSVTKKMLAAGVAGVSTGAAASPSQPGYTNCWSYATNTANRYIFRLKPIFPAAAANVDSSTVQNQYSVNYRMALVTAPGFTSVYIPDSNYIIDVVGQSGEIKRRLVARKDRSGRLTGIFDYLLYSNNSLCKLGINSDDVSYGNGGACDGVTSANND